MISSDTGAPYEHQPNPDPEQPQTVDPLAELAEPEPDAEPEPEASVETSVVGWVAAVRKESGVTQGQIAEMMKTGQNGVSDIERGANTNPKVETLARYIDAVAKATDTPVRLVISVERLDPDKGWTRTASETVTPRDDTAP